MSACLRLRKLGMHNVERPPGLYAAGMMNINIRPSEHHVLCHVVQDAEIQSV